jgi:hypothetical protein
MREKYYNEDIKFPKFTARLNLNSGDVNYDMGTFLMSVCLFSDTENRRLTYEERMKIINTTIDKLQEWRDDIKKRALMYDLAGLKDE